MGSKTGKKYLVEDERRCGAVEEKSYHSMVVPIMLARPTLTYLRRDERSAPAAGPMSLRIDQHDCMLRKSERERRFSVSRQRGVIPLQTSSMSDGFTSPAPLCKARTEDVLGRLAGYVADPDGHLWEVAFNPALLPEN
jgi:hypothetical protein